MLRKLLWARTLLGSLSAMRRGLTLASRVPSVAGVPNEPPNPLSEYFDSISTGPGIVKWRHYFEIYHRHLAKFVGQPVTVLEIGIYSGGSLPMWRHYFGQQASIVGVDIEPACKAYEAEGIRVFIGDQADRSFWAKFRKEVPRVDVLIDDGGHTPEQQSVTLEEMLPHLAPGGVYICEDIHGSMNRFTSLVGGLAHALNTDNFKPGEAAAEPTDYQNSVHSIHCYPWLVAIEKRSVPAGQFVGPKHGTQWQPFLK